MDFNAWDEGTVELPLEQEAAYLRLCHQMYRMGGPIYNSPKLLQAIFRCGHNKAQALLRKLIAAHKIMLSDDGLLSQSRVSRELVYRESMSSLRRVSGGLGGSRSGVARRKSLNGHETGEAIADALRSRGEERREEEKKESSLRSPKKPENEHGPPNRGSRLDAAWQPTASDTEFAAELGCEPSRIAMTAARFRDYWLSAAGKAAVKRDWSAAWRNWVRKDLEDRATGMPKEERRDQFGRRAG
jgi:hypothetical protein